MTFCIVTHVSHGYQNGCYFAYAPYVKEINIWLKHVDKVILVAPFGLNCKKSIESDYIHQDIEFRKVEKFNFLTIKSILYSIIYLPKISFEIYNAMKESDHIHLRCPGNMGLLGCLIQILFPNKTKTAKYAGNWDLTAKQPLSYKIQKWILSNTFLTKNMKVLVYGEWYNSSKNIKPFFTASYNESEKIEVQDKNLKGRIRFMFVGTLYKGKQPLYAIKIIEELKKLNLDIQLFIYGDGIQKTELQDYIFNNKLNDFVFLEGNKNHNEIKNLYQENHFVILPSKSEGWPKVIAEGMFWKCLPIATRISCVPNMLNQGERGLLLTMDLKKDIKIIKDLLNNEPLYISKSNMAYEWSRNFTLDYFDKEIKLLLK